MKIRIRKIKPDDYNLVRNLITSIPEFSAIDQTIAIELLDWAVLHPKSDEYTVLVAVTEQKVRVGFLCYGPTPLTTGTYDLYWIGIHPNISGKGVGKSLIKSMEKRIRAKHGRLILIETSSAPIYQKACRFYLKQGYQLQERIPDFYQVGEDRFTFVKKVKYKKTSRVKRLVLA